MRKETRGERISGRRSIANFVRVDYNGMGRSIIEVVLHTSAVHCPHHAGAAHTPVFHKIKNKFYIMLIEDSIL